MNDIIERNIDGYELTAQAIQTIVEIENKMSNLKEVYDEYKKALQGAMEKHGIEKIDTDYFTVSYVKPHQTTKFNSKAFKSENPEIASKYETVSEVKGSVRVRLKG